MSRVVCVGSVNVDMVVSLPKLPHPGETVIGGVYKYYQGGKGANQAVAIARLGGEVVLVGAVGKDDFGVQAADELTLEGVKLSLIQNELPTGVAQIMVDKNGENIIAVASGANNALEPEDIKSFLLPDLIENAVVLANLEVPYETILTAARLARNRNCKVILNPAPAQPLSPDLLCNCNILTPNEHEVRALGFEDITDVFQYGVEAVIVTRGVQGADLFRPGYPIYHQDAFQIKAIDTTGAGDTFNAALAWAISNDEQIVEALRLAVAAGALATRSLGARAGMPTRSELIDFVFVSKDG
jgi:ribokinase